MMVKPIDNKNTIKILKGLDNIKKSIKLKLDWLSLKESNNLKLGSFLFNIGSLSTMGVKIF